MALPAIKLPGPARRAHLDASRDGEAARLPPSTVRAGWAADGEG